MTYSELWAKAKKMGWQGKKAGKEILQRFVSDGDRIVIDTKDIEPIVASTGFKNVSGKRLVVFGKQVDVGGIVKTENVELMRALKEFVEL